MTNDVLTALLHEPRCAWRAAPPSHRVAYATGSALVLVGLAHGVAWLLVGGAWDGPVSFRKPFSFGTSFGLTTITLTWITQRMGIRGRRGAWWVLAIAGASVAEVLWVSVQRARGVASHFNVDGGLDTLAFSVVGGGAIGVLAVAVAVLTWSVARNDGGDRAFAVASRWGLLALWLAIAAGGVMISLGNARAAGGQTTDLVRYGAAGSVKVTHALGIHGIQVLPGVAFLLAAGGVPSRRRARAVGLAGLGYVALIVAATLQWLAGRALSDPGVLDGAVALAGGAALLAAVWTAARGSPASTAAEPPAGPQATPAS